jgi:hypothetical protein
MGGKSRLDRQPAQQEQAAEQGSQGGSHGVLYSLLPAGSDGPASRNAAQPAVMTPSPLAVIISILGCFTAFSMAMRPGLPGAMPANLRRQAELRLNQALTLLSCGG